MAVRLLAALAGVVLVVLAFRSVIRTFVLPRSARDGIARVVFWLVRFAFTPLTSARRAYAARDGALALFAPVSLLATLGFWLLLVLVGYGTLYWAMGIGSLEECLLFSGSSLTTLGFVAAKTVPQAALAVSEAVAGLILVALLIAYLPTMYNAFSKRESAVTMLVARAGNPPAAVEMILRYHRLGRLEHMDDLWEAWEVWFAELQETHTSLAALAFFRSPQPTHSWITAAGTLLDAAALRASTLAVSREPQAELTMRAGFLALRAIADFFDVPYNPNPQPTDPITVRRDEFDDAYDEMQAVGIPLREREEAWRSFAGWRVNYDVPLVAIAKIVVAPPAPWSSDRSLLLHPRKRVPFLARLRGTFTGHEGFEEVPSERTT